MIGIKVLYSPTLPISPGLIMTGSTLLDQDIDLDCNCGMGAKCLFVRRKHEKAKIIKRQEQHSQHSSSRSLYNFNKELLTKIASLGQGSISLLSSKEQEQEQRALLLKRLAWVIFCSDIDQYQRQMPDITDRLSECLRTVPVSPMVQSAVFLCFRVILLRMSASHVTFLWPLIITEMVVVFSNMEQELSSCSPEFR